MIMALSGLLIYLLQNNIINKNYNINNLKM